MSAQGHRGGRPTRAARLYEDTADKLAWVLLVTDDTSASFIEARIGGDVSSLYAKHQSKIEAAKAAMQKLKRNLPKTPKVGGN